MKKKLVLVFCTIILAGFILPMHSSQGHFIDRQSDFGRNLKPDPQNPIQIGNRLELFIDDYLIDRLNGAELRLHHPVPREIVLRHNAPWEGSGSGYHSIFKDGDIYRMYYKAWQHSASKTPTHPLYCCYAESKDGINWKKPNLGLYDFQGSKDNNIVFISGLIGKVIVNAGHPAIFKDDNPDVEPDARYKAILRTDKPVGIIPFKSPDGIHWTIMSDTPVITDGAFDSQNLAFWDSFRGEYWAYWRYFDHGIRSIRTATSSDMIHWNHQSDLIYADTLKEQLYTNQIKPYYRAPQIFIGFPARYLDRGWSESMRELPEYENRKWRSGKSERFGTALTEGLIMVSHDGVNFKRWNEAFLRPGIERPGTWNYGQQYIAWSVVETKSSLEGAPDELSLYAVENYWTGTSTSLRRYTIRVDGFVSVNAPLTGGEIITKPLIFTGKNLVINFSSSAAGSVRVEIEDKDGNPLPGYSLDDCPYVFGDTLARTVAWKNGSDLSDLIGKTVRLRIFLKDADLYSLQFK